jgi:hypothetical protein
MQTKGGAVAVLVEGISVIVRRDAVEQHTAGGWNAFMSIIPNNTFCTDEEIARIGFLAPADVNEFIDRLKDMGLTFLDDRGAVDLAVVDQQHGPTTPCDWLEFGHLPFGDGGGKVAACWLFTGPRIAHGLHLPGLSMQLVTPAGWQYDDSLSHNFVFIPSSTG